MRQDRNVFTINNLLIFAFSITVSISTVYSQTEVTGFFDLLSSQNINTNTSHEFSINQFELDVTYAHQSNFSVGTAVAYNSELENMELAMAFVHYSFDDGPALHPRREETYDHSAFLIGKFDMPFGLDYLSFASTDRPTISQPLVIEKTIGGWNDVGIDFHMFKGNFKFDVWAVNGFADGVGLGGNIRYTLFPFMELGASHSSDITSFDEVEDWINGVDLQINTNMFQFKSEYLWMEGVYEGELDVPGIDDQHHGVYFQLLTEFEDLISLPLYLTLRYGGWGSDFDRDQDGTNDCQNRYTAALGYRLHDNLSLRLEMLSNQVAKLDRENQVFLQAVVAF